MNSKIQKRRLQVGDVFRLNKDDFLSKAGTLVSVTKIIENDGWYWAYWQECLRPRYNGCELIYDGQEPEIESD